MTNEQIKIMAGNIVFLEQNKETEDPNGTRAKAWYSFAQRHRLKTKLEKELKLLKTA